MILAIIERIEDIKERAPFNNRYYLTEYYKKIFDELGILLFPIISTTNLEKVCNICDGLIITGSCIDIPPHYYNENPVPNKNYDIDEFKLDKEAIKLFSNANKPILGICGGLQSINVYFPNKNYDIDEFKLDKEAIKLFSNANKPILGICGGLQSINVYFGGSLNQKIENHDLKNKLHKIHIKDGSFLNSVYKENANVNSYHKQSIKDVASVVV
ncbi:anthranilate synthase component II [Clostridium sp. CAG:440]|nr:anthranilate synthase component II [Clostridium sp. CAG:440]